MAADLNINNYNDGKYEKKDDALVFDNFLGWRKAAFFGKEIIWR